MALRPEKGSARGVTGTLMARAIAPNVTPVAVKMDNVLPSFVATAEKDLKVASTAPRGDDVAVKVPVNAPDRPPLKTWTPTEMAVSVAKNSRPSTNADPNEAPKVIVASEAPVAPKVIVPPVVTAVLKAMVGPMAPMVPKAIVALTDPVALKAMVAPTALKAPNRDQMPRPQNNT